MTKKSVLIFGKSEIPVIIPTTVIAKIVLNESTQNRTVIRKLCTFRSSQNTDRIINHDVEKCRTGHTTLRNAVQNSERTRQILVESHLLSAISETVPSPRDGTIDRNVP